MKRQCHLTWDGSVTLFAGCEVQSIGRQRKVAHFQKSIKMKSITIRQSGFLLLIFFVTGFHKSPQYAQPLPQKQTTLYWAEMLVKHITSQNTDYRHKEIAVVWADNNGADSWQCFADCSGFINALLKQTYAWDDAYFKKWLGKNRPMPIIISTLLLQKIISGKYIILMTCSRVI